MIHKLLGCFLVFVLGCNDPTDTAKRFDPKAVCVIGSVGYCLIKKIPYYCDSYNCLPILTHPVPMVMMEKPADTTPADVQ